MELDFPFLVMCLVGLAAASGVYHMGYRRGVNKVERIVRDHRDGMNVKFNIMKLEAQEKLRAKQEAQSKEAL